MKIFKYILNNPNNGRIVGWDLPESTKVLSVGLDPKKNVCVWCEVNEADIEACADVRFEFRIAGTGFDSPSTFKYTFIGTVIDDPYVWHIYYLKYKL